MIPRNTDVLQPTRLDWIANRRGNAMTTLRMLIALLLVAGGVFAQDSQSPPVANNTLRLELLRRLEQDQAIRNQLIPKGLDRLTDDRQRSDEPEAIPD